MANRARADINPDTPTTKRLRRDLQTARRRWEKADAEAKSQSKEIDRLCHELKEAGWTDPATAELAGIDARHVSARVRRHLDVMT
jgi:hypothetical protein